MTRAEQGPWPRRDLMRAALATGALALLAPRRARAATAFAATADAARALPQLRSLAIARQGETVFAEAFRGPAPDRPVNVKSVSKTLVAALAGAAIDRGLLPGVGAALGSLIPDLIPSEADPRVRDITLEHLLTMRAGLERTSGGNYGGWVASRNWVADALRRPFVDSPGGRMLYSTGSSHVLGVAVARAADDSLLDLARAWLGRPLGIEIPGWTRDPQGNYLGGNEMALSPLAMLRVGEMYRGGGTLDGTRVLGAEFVAQSLVRRTQSQFSGLGYGYGWFLGTLGHTPATLARGYGGQVICILPELEMTVAITSDPTLPARSDGHFGDLMALIGDTLVPEARSQWELPAAQAAPALPAPQDI